MNGFDRQKRFTKIIRGTDHDWIPWVIHRTLLLVGDVMMDSDEQMHEREILLLIDKWEDEPEEWIP